MLMTPGNIGRIGGGQRPLSLAQIFAGGGVGYLFDPARAYSDAGGSVPVVAGANIVSLRDAARGGLVVVANANEQAKSVQRPRSGRRNQAVGTDAPVTQTVSGLAAGQITVSFNGSGGVSLSGIATGSKSGVDAATRSSVTVTAAAGGSLTVTLSGSVTNLQVEAGAVATPYQSAPTAYLTTEAGYAPVYGWMPDATDVLTITRASGEAGQLLLVGAGGAYLVDCPSSLGTAITVGPTAAAGLAGIVTALAPLTAVLYLPRAWTMAEARWAARTYGFAGKGLLVVGGELVSNGGFDAGLTGWSANNGAALSVVAGELLVASAGLSYGGACAAIQTEVGQTYVVRATCRRGSASLGWVLAGSTFANSNRGIFPFASTGPISVTGIFTAIGATSYITVQTDNNVPNGTVYADNVSVKPLIPEAQ